MTHERFIHAVRDISVARLNDPAERERLKAVKLVYGSGVPGSYGVCIYGVWNRHQPHDFIEISAAEEESRFQLAATVIHELGHASAGYQAGHGPQWQAATRALGLLRPRAAGCAADHQPDAFAPDILPQILKLGDLTDGRPRFTGAAAKDPGPCPLGIGTKGGTSRGPGSGSRLRRYVCDCNPQRPVRVGRNEFRAICLDCNGAFKREDKPRKRNTP